MKRKNILGTALLAVTALLASCQYEYDMPDMSGVKYHYSVDSLPQDLEEELLRKTEETGRPMETFGARMAPVVREKDAQGNVLYEGPARGTVDDRAQTVQLGYRCEARLPEDLTIADRLSDTYYGMSCFWFERSYPVEISPAGMRLRVKSSDTYTADLAAGSAIYAVSNQFGQVIFADVEAAGYESPSVAYTFEERDAQGNVVNTVEPSSIGHYHFASEAGARSVTISLTVMAQPPHDYRSEKLFTYTFTKPFALNVFKVNEIVLSPDLAYTRSSKGAIYAVKNSMKSQLAADIEAAGYDWLGIDYADITVTERNDAGMAVKSYLLEDDYTAENTRMAAKGATSVEVTVQAYGRAPGESGRTLLFEYRFSPVKLDMQRTTVIELTEDGNYTRTTPDASKLASVYTFANGMKDVVQRDLEREGYEWYGIEYVDYTITEKNSAGRAVKRYDLADGVRLPDEPTSSAKGATSVEVEMHTYGRDAETGERTHVYTYTFAPIALDPFAVTNIVLSTNLKYTRTRP